MNSIAKTLFEADNARALTSREVASTFVPTKSFWRLLSAKNHIVFGARGSGKTALARMLSHENLSLFDNDSAKDIINKKSLIGIYVPMRMEWVGGLNNKPWQTAEMREDFFSWRLNISTCLAFLTTVTSCIRAYLPEGRPRAEMERSIAAALGEGWLHDQSLSDLSQLEAKIRRIEYGRQQELARLRVSDLNGDGMRPSDIGAEFAVELFAPIRYGVWVVNSHMNFPETTRWILCLDEAEFLQEDHHKLLNSALRSYSEHLYFKITTMPYEHHTLETTTGAPLHEGHDFEYIYMDHDPAADVDSRNTKNEYMEFALNIFTRRALSEGWDINEFNLDKLLGQSLLLDASHSEDWTQNSPLRQMLHQHCDIATITRAERYCSEIENATTDEIRKEISADFMNTIGRKLRGALLLKTAKSERQGAKKLDVYSGTSMLIRCADGNPRRLVRLFNQMILAAKWKEDGKANSIIPTYQTDIFQKFSSSTLERVRAEKDIGPELYTFLNEIGQSLHYMMHGQKIATDLIGTISLSENEFERNATLIKRAIGLGLIYAHFNDANRDYLPMGACTCRLSYVLSPHFLLLPRRGRANSLGTLARTKSVKKVIKNIRKLDQHTQPRLNFGD